MPGTDMIFQLSGKVVDSHGVVVPNHSLEATVDYWQFISGVSTEESTPITFSSDTYGYYGYTFPGPGNPLIGWDSSKEFIVTVGNNQSGWRTFEPGQWGGYLHGSSPIPVAVNVTGVTQMMSKREQRRLEAISRVS